MIRLTFFELSKIWKKRSFMFSAILLLFINVFLLWYTALSDGTTPPPSAYKAVWQDLSMMSDVEKSVYIDELYETVSGVTFVRDVLNMQALSGEMGASLAEQEMQKNPQIFEKYYDLYLSEDYLKYTESLEQEKVLIQELFKEKTKVYGYEAYLDSVQNNRDMLGGISIFEDKAEDNFSSRNIKKSAADYAALTTENIHWFPSKGITSSLESLWTDILLILAVFLFVGSLITEEKEKGLFYITRATKYGMGTGISAKLFALFIHCLTAVTVAYIGNLLFFSGITGLGDLTARIQSIAPYMESNLNISVLAYIGFTIITKGMVLFFFGTILTAVSIFSNKSFMPYLFGIGIVAASWLFYQMIPIQSAWNLAKYLNLAGLMRTEDLYGAYLNFNVFGYLVAQVFMTWIAIIICTVSGIIASIILFVRKQGLEIKRVHVTLPIRFRPHNNLFLHESYKILITNRAMVILLLFAVLISWKNVSKEYHPSVQEQYYQNFMLQLEGTLTDNKESMILSEQERFEEAFAQIERIDAMVANGEISENTGDSMKQSWYGVTAFYPAFEKIMAQYKNIKVKGGRFIYDTGYLYLFGNLDNTFAIQLLFLSLCVIFSFGNVIPMEYQKKSWNLLCATQKGKNKIIGRKIAVCLLCAGGLTILPWLFRSKAITRVYPMNGVSSLIQAIPHYKDFAFEIPIWCFYVAAIFSQLVAMSIVTLLVLLISEWRKNHVQSLFFAMLILAIPLVLKILGLDFAGWISVYPLYAWTGLL